MKETANNTYNVGNIYADGSNVVIGDAINSSLNIDNSYTRIENRIEKLERENIKSDHTKKTKPEKQIKFLKIIFM